MGAMPSRAQSEFYKGLLPVELSIEAPAVQTADPKNDWFSNGQPSYGKQASRPFAGFLISVSIGVVATLAWQSYSEAARQIVASLSPRLGWLAPHAAAARTVPNVVEQITRHVDRIVDANRDQIAASQEQIMRSVDNLAAGQEQMTREIIRLQAISQYGSYKNAEPPPRPASASAHNAVQRPSQAH